MQFYVRLIVGACASLTVLWSAGAIHAQTISTTAPPQPLPAATPQNTTSNQDYFDTPPNKSGGYQQPPLSKQEVNQFLEEMKNVGREATQMLKQMKGAKVPTELPQTLQNVISEARQCIETVKVGALNDDTRQLINDCHQKNLFNDINDVRQEFVPPSEVKNALRDIDNQKRQIQQVKKQMTKAGGSSASADEIISRLDALQQAIQNAVGQNQRDAMQDYWDARMWEEVNALRAAVDIPKELKQIEKEMARLQKATTSKQYKEAVEFFGAQASTIAQLVEQKQGAITEIKSLVASGQYEDAREVMNDSIYQGWHPGDFMHALDMMKETRRMLKNIRNTEVQQTVKDIITPVVANFVDGNVRAARDTLVIVQEQVRRMEYTLGRSRSIGSGGDLDDKTLQAIEKLEQLIEASGGASGGGGGGDQQRQSAGFGNGGMPPPPPPTFVGPTGQKN